MRQSSAPADFAGPAGPRRLLFDVFRRQRRRVLLGAACWISYQTCEVLVPVAIGIAVDAAVSTSDLSALIWSVVMIFAVFITLTASWRTGAWLLVAGHPGRGAPAALGVDAAGPERLRHRHRAVQR